MTYSICIDIGGTFTDCVVVEHGKGMKMFKSSSTPGEFQKGFMDVIALASEHYGYSLKDFLGLTDVIVHGTTVSTNALVEEKTARVGLICNAGYPDILTLREAPRKGAFAWRLDYPEPFVLRNLTCGVQGRIDANGNEITPLNEKDIRSAIAHFRKMGVEAIAVSFLWSTVNNSHEQRTREIISEEWRDIPVTLGHELNPIPREYRRTISAAIDASLNPIVSSYVNVLRDTLTEAGYRNEFLLANCIGGMMPPDEIIRKPIFSVMSGPTLAPIAASHLSEAPDVIVIDMGGTTFDVSAIRANQIVITSEAMLGSDMLGISKVDVRSVGAGGGSIAWVDAGGLLKVGPKSAGARPGPVCYDLGGTQPTVTDANVVLGIIDPDYFLGGRLKLNRNLAEEAIGKISKQLGISVLSAAYAIYTTSNFNMIAAIEDITIKEGINPRDSYLVTGGGATSCHIGEIAKELGMKRLMIPKLSAGLSAYGGIISDISWEETATLLIDSRRFAFSEVNRLLEELRDKGQGFLNRAQIPKKSQRFEYSFMGRYEFQSWEIEVPFSLPKEGITEATMGVLVSAFHEMHERIYTIRCENDAVEFVTWKVHAIGKKSDLDLHETPLKPQDGEPQPKSHRPVYVREIGESKTLPVFDGKIIGAKARIEGPALIEEETTTILLLRGMVAETDTRGNYLIEM